MNEFIGKCCITGKKLTNRLNSAKLSSYELDEIFLDESMLFAYG